MGRTHQADSGYASAPWVAGQQANRLNNEYYVSLLDEEEAIGWTHWENTQTGKFQWVDEDEMENGGGVIMLNADMCFVLDIDDHIDADTGEVSCPARSGCGDNGDTIDTVREYAEDNQLWLEDFAGAFDKMIQTGYDEGGLTEFTVSDNVAASHSANAVVESSTVSVDREALMSLLSMFCEYVAC